MRRIEVVAVEYTRAKEDVESITAQLTAEQRKLFIDYRKAVQREAELLEELQRLAGGKVTKQREEAPTKTRRKLLKPATVLELVDRAAGRNIQAQQVVNAFGSSSSTASNMLSKLARDGAIQRVGRGVFRSLGNAQPKTQQPLFRGV